MGPGCSNARLHAAASGSSLAVGASACKVIAHRADAELTRGSGLWLRAAALEPQSKDLRNLAHADAIHAGGFAERGALRPAQRAG